MYYILVENAKQAQTGYTTFKQSMQTVCNHICNADLFMIANYTIILAENNNKQSLCCNGTEII